MDRSPTAVPGPVPPRPLPADALLTPSTVAVVGYGLIAGVFGVLVVVGLGQAGAPSALVFAVLAIALPGYLVGCLVVDRVEIHGTVLTVKRIGSTRSVDVRNVVAVHRAGGKNRPAHLEVVAGSATGRAPLGRPNRVVLPPTVSTRRVAAALGTQSVPYGSMWAGLFPRTNRSYHQVPPYVPSYVPSYEPSAGPSAPPMGDEIKPPENSSVGRFF